MNQPPTNHSRSYFVSAYKELAWFPGVKFKEKYFKIKKKFYWQWSKQCYSLYKILCLGQNSAVILLSTLHLFIFLMCCVTSVAFYNQYLSINGYHLTTSLKSSPFNWVTDMLVHYLSADKKNTCENFIRIGQFDLQREQTDTNNVTQFTWSLINRSSTSCLSPARSAHTWSLLRRVATHSRQWL